MKNCYFGNRRIQKLILLLHIPINMNRTPEYIEKLIETKKNDSYINFTLTIRDIKNKKLFVEVPTTISRYNITQ